jgi:Domain found in Dishevelled, Egl-10, and Pleckstrin (DEP)
VGTLNPTDVDVKTSAYSSQDENDDNDEDDDDDDDNEACRTSRLLRLSDVLRKRSDSLSNSLQGPSGGKAPKATRSSVGGSIGELSVVAKESSTGSRRSSEESLAEFHQLNEHSLSSNLAYIQEYASANNSKHGNTSSNPPSLSSVALTAAGPAHGLKQPASLQETMSTIACMAKVTVKDRRYRFRTYRQCFIGSQLIDVLMEHECASTRKEALRMAMDINKRFRLFAHVVDDHDLKDDVRAWDDVRPA